MLKAVGMTKGAIEKMVCLEGIYYGIIPLRKINKISIIDHIKMEE